MHVSFGQGTQFNLLQWVRTKARMLIAVSPLSQALPKLTVSRLVLTFISVHVFI